MTEYLKDILHTILERFIKKSVMDKATSKAKLAKDGVNEKVTFLPTKNGDIGFATRKILRDVQTEQKVSDGQVFEFKNYCILFLQSLATKLLERCPLQYQVVRYLTCLDPRIMVGNPDQAIRKMTELLENMMTLK